jgi:TRAP-type C4-dicarboxylate transport system permease small subunit
MRFSVMQWIAILFGICMAVFGLAILYGAAQQFQHDSRVIRSAMGPLLVVTAGVVLGLGVLYAAYRVIAAALGHEESD